MKLVLKAMLYTAICVMGAPSHADIVIDFTSANNPLTNVNDFSPGTSSTTQLGDIGNTDIEVLVMSDVAMVAQGATTLNPDSGTALMTSSGSLMISFPNVLGVRDFSQNLDFTGSGNNSSEINGMDDVMVTVDFTDGMGNNPSQTTTSLDFEDSGSDRYDVTATMNEIITKITLKWINDAEITSSKQIRINSASVAAVPEPSAALLLSIVSVGVIGYKRFRRSRS